MKGNTIPRDLERLIEFTIEKFQVSRDAKLGERVQALATVLQQQLPETEAFTHCYLSRSAPTLLLCLRYGKEDRTFLIVCDEREYEEELDEWVREVKEEFRASGWKFSKVRPTSLGMWLALMYEYFRPLPPPKKN